MAAGPRWKCHSETDLQDRFPAWEFIHGEPMLLWKNPWFGCAWVCLEYTHKHGLMKPE